MGKSLLDRIKELEEYHPDITYRDGSFILKIKFKNSWSVIQPEDERVAYAVDDKTEGLHWYLSSIEDSDMVFDSVEETIAVNKEMEKKLLLYKEKVKELQEIFLSDIQYEKLITLKFTFPDSAKKTRNKPKPKQEPLAKTDETEEKPVEAEAIIPNEIKTQEINDIDQMISEALQ